MKPMPNLRGWVAWLGGLAGWFGLAWHRPMHAYRPGPMASAIILPQQVRLYLWSDFKRILRALKILSKQVMWAISYLRDEIFTRFEPYISYYLKKRSVADCDLIITKVVNTIRHYLALLL
jgi:hypothetical protein